MFCNYWLRLTMYNSRYLHNICIVKLCTNFSSIAQFYVNFFLQVKPYIHEQARCNHLASLGNSVPRRIKQTLVFNFHKSFNANLGRKLFLRGQSIFPEFSLSMRLENKRLTFSKIMKTKKPKVLMSFVNLFCICNKAF